MSPANTSPPSSGTGSSRRPSLTGEWLPKVGKPWAFGVQRDSWTHPTGCSQAGWRPPRTLLRPPPPGSGALRSPMIREADPPAQTIPLFPEYNFVHPRVSVTPGNGHSAYLPTTRAAEKGKIHPSANTGSLHVPIVCRRNTSRVPLA